MIEHNSDQAAAHFGVFAHSFFEKTRDARALKAAIFASLSPEWKKVVKGSDFAVAELAIDVIGQGDAEMVLGVYGAGGKIADEVVGALDNAVKIARRKKDGDAKSEFFKIAKRHGWDF